MSISCCATGTVDKSVCNCAGVNVAVGTIVGIVEEPPVELVPVERRADEEEGRAVEVAVVFKLKEFEVATRGEAEGTAGWW